jgi:transcriptional regulator of aromatic amino acid metabolism
MEDNLETHASNKMLRLFEILRAQDRKGVSIAIGPIIPHKTANAKIIQRMRISGFLRVGITEMNRIALEVEDQIILLEITPGIIRTEDDIVVIVRWRIIIRKTVHRGLEVATERKHSTALAEILEIRVRMTETIRGKDRIVKMWVQTLVVVGVETTHGILRIGKTMMEEGAERLHAILRIAQRIQRDLHKIID